MTTNPRDTQFLGFAARLLQELLDQCAYVVISPDVTGGDSFKSEQLIAQRAYDLVKHALDYAEVDPLGGHLDQMVSLIPDLTQWPEEAK